MKTIIRQHSQLFINPAFLVIFTPILWIGLFLFTKSIFGTIYLYVWTTMMTTTFALFNDKDIRESWSISVFCYVMFFISLIEILLYLRILL
jgi:hypothetical protein